MFKKVRKNLKSDKGASATIELLILIVIIFAIFLSIIDFGLYFSNKNIITNVAQNGARLAAVYGGAGDTPVSRLYGANQSYNTGNCLKINTPNQVSCSVTKELEETKGLSNAVIKSVKCGPNITKKIGERTYCEVKWEYKSVGPGLSFASLVGEQTVKMTSESEVVSR